ncbi:hypothetical protein GWN26_13610 [Candidatus Saccharibacteria bacterium]|nr:hypothetical protein [Candidatus Saccharibacteria bacterium]NIV04353.1 hypothetical protein [Calditrichia bacterium]NIV72878.1 hypothetical protein [Calditrichia bacterium]NIW00094.1 hypothetical protein [Candidatus Saccharibacteria bacterium]NIW80434.1 hypothetical protein [Calditrichia bacterium]
MIHIYRYILYIFLLIPFFFLAGKERPAIAVKFELGEASYRNNFYDQEIKRIEERSAGLICAKLKAYIGFLDYVQSGSADSLIITLDTRDQFSAESQLKEVGFHLKLKGPNIAAAVEPIYWMFRSWKHYDLPLGEADAFIRNITTTFESHLKDKFNQLVEELLSNYQLGEEAMLIPEDLTWVLPFKKDSLGVAEGSLFKVKNQVQRSYGSKIREYRAEVVGIFTAQNSQFPQKYYLGILAEALPEQRYLDDIRTEQSMRPQGIYILKYIPHAGSQSIPPTEFDIGEGGE